MPCSLCNQLMACLPLQLSVPHCSASLLLVAHLVLLCCSFLCPSSFPCAFGLVSAGEGKSCKLGILLSISSLWLNPECWLLESVEISRDFKIPNSQISASRVSSEHPGLILDSGHRTWAPAGSVNPTPGLGTSGGKCVADWCPRSKVEEKAVLASISEQPNQFNARFLPAHYRLPRPFTPPPPRTPLPKYSILISYISDSLSKNLLFGRPGFARLCKIC
ncbi:hypothetical protein TIFTF001_009175 [Ficus carica]|uniref:Uncharacterized protein n=1 Tax=Ficus carica TaxID=3494 RepID=A0AA88D143_FICCA|nr:hypothetical protein TIFTF001_009175 [Ficus carica]